MQPGSLEPFPWLFTGRWRGGRSNPKPKIIYFGSGTEFSERIGIAKALVLWWMEVIHFCPRSLALIFTEVIYIDFFFSFFFSIISPANPVTAHPVLQSARYCSWDRVIHKFYEFTLLAVFPSLVGECHARQCHILNKRKKYHICCFLFIHLAGYSDKERN